MKHVYVDNESLTNCCWSKIKNQITYSKALDLLKEIKLEIENSNKIRKLLTNYKKTKPVIGDNRMIQALIRLIDTNQPIST